MDLNTYFENLRGKRVAVLGVGVSNLPLTEMLLSYGAKVTLHDKKTALTGKAFELSERCAGVRLGDDYLDNIEADVIFRSPGIRPDEEGILKAVNAGAVLTSEMEAFFEVCPCPIKAITGSDGKTTTTTITALMLEAAGKKVHLGGNIGTPLLCGAGEMSPDDVAVVELSSFQLMTMKKSAPGAIITNLAPNHLDKHKGLEEYYSSKKNVFLAQGSDGLLVLNKDNAVTASMASEAKGKVKFFSRREKVDNGAYYLDNTVYLVDNGVSRKLFDRSDILLLGDHNVENYMAAAALLDGEVPDEAMRAVARSFKGVEHRLELCREKDGVKFYNDSIASSPTRTAAGLRCFDEKVVLIAGGYDKKIPFDDFGPEVCSHVKVLTLFGPTAGKIRASVEAAKGEKPEIILCSSFDEAVLTAANAAKAGDSVLMSPACASFDSFANFMERGERFKQLVAAL